ncbi:hypothetical protein AMATHDRAFT_88739 [Amanita thiersii Skay4041]|uniref:BTB domain-containing protein n=1 Tax=Amanita thiersii Skay4041 TaxID=703135 RepID=A0A2A9NCZ8_9AGAR|nr:hypothetical protein AMATHDRAFT_88739 [Amanita thiersii Skay4041]
MAGGIKDRLLSQKPRNRTKNLEAKTTAYCTRETLKQTYLHFISAHHFFHSLNKRNHVSDIKQHFASRLVLHNHFLSSVTTISPFTTITVYSLANTLLTLGMDALHWRKSVPESNSDRFRSPSYEILDDEISIGTIKYPETSPITGKRARESSSDDSGYASPKPQKAPKKYVECKKHWLSDGSTLVQIGKTRYKLNRSTLVRHSKWFRRKIQKGSEKRIHSSDHDTVFTVTDHVYELDDLDITSKDFETWLDAINDSIMLERRWPEELSSLTTTVLPDATNTVNIGREYGITSIIKRAMYELVRTEGFRDKEDDDDGTPSVEDQELALLLTTRGHLTRLWMAKAIPDNTFLRNCPSLSLSNYQESCLFEASFQDLYRLYMHETGIFQKFKYDPVCGLQALIDVPWAEGEKWDPAYDGVIPVVNQYLCKDCSMALRCGWKENREELWELLDEWFGITMKGRDTEGERKD